MEWVRSHAIGRDNAGEIIFMINPLTPTCSKLDIRFEGWRYTARPNSLGKSYQLVPVGTNARNQRFDKSGTHFISLDIGTVDVSGEV